MSGTHRSTIEKLASEKKPLPDRAWTAVTLAKNDSRSPDADPLEIVRHVFEERVAFNRFLGLRVEALDPECAKVRFDMRDELVGNFIRGSLHGGVISAALDTLGGLVAFLSVLQRDDPASFEAGLQRLGNIGTIDLRIDYLRSGVGRSFLGTASILRAGNKVAVTRMELHNNEDTLIAVGTGTYLVG